MDRGVALALVTSWLACMACTACTDGSPPNVRARGRVSAAASAGSAAVVAAGSGAAPAPAPAPAQSTTAAAATAAAKSEPAGARRAGGAYAGIAQPPPVAVLTELGRRMFFDPALSASGKLACASCHAPARGMAPDNARAIQRGGADRQQLGFRATPALRYLSTAGRFTEHAFDSSTGVDQGPTGGLLWDGRMATPHDQAWLPLFAPFEMANPSRAALAAKLRRAPYAGELRVAFGAEVLDDEDRALAVAALALEVFEQSPPDFYPYDSKLDAVIRGRATLTAREARGFALFNAPGKGNCASCHPSSRSEGGFPAFTDFGYVALGVPRARGIPANADPKFFDLGLCGPLRQDLADRAEYCGMFRTPSLRNVALRRRLFHNGSFASLTEVVRFYATRDVAPERWYPRDAAGKVRKFDDLPARYRGNVNMEPPFGGEVGGKPALDEGEIGDIVVFLATLTDGYRP